MKTGEYWKEGRKEGDMNIIQKQNTTKNITHGKMVSEINAFVRVYVVCMYVCVSSLMEEIKEGEEKMKKGEVAEGTKCKRRRRAAKEVSERGRVVC